jgi:hypothetical protein
VVGTGGRVVVVVRIVVTGILVTGVGAGLLVVHPATRRRNTRAAIVRADTKLIPARCAGLFRVPFFMIIP